MAKINSARPLIEKKTSQIFQLSNPGQLSVIQDNTGRSPITTKSYTLAFCRIKLYVPLSSIISIKYPPFAVIHCNCQTIG